MTRKQDKSTLRTQPLPTISSLCREWPALGLGVLLLVRPWFDGMVFFNLNTYFNAVLILLATFWGIRQLRRPQSVRGGMLLLLLAAFILIAWSGIGSTVRYDITVRHLLVWGGYFLLFLLVSQCAVSTRGFTIILGALIAASFAETLYSIVHYHYILPILREQMITNPDYVASVVGTSASDPEFLHRLNVNRAFGTFMFPNALAAFFTLGIPVGVILAARLRHITGPIIRTDRDRQVGLVLGGACCCVAWLLGYVLYGGFVVPRSDQPILGLFIWMIAVPFSLMAVAFLLIVKRGVRAGVQTLALWFLIVWTVLQVCGLWLTKSRGAMLATVAALLAAFLISRVSGVKRILPIVLVCAVCMMGADTPSTPLTSEGIDVSLSDLANPATAMLRLSYWNVGLRIAKAYPLRGVGLGNFKEAYPVFQAPGEGDVEAAHNDYLQTLCETGVPGCLALCLFFGWFLVWGFFKMRREDDDAQRRLLAAMYFGVLAFLLHALVDFNFQNPSLMYFMFVLMGGFVAQAAPSRPTVGGGQEDVHSSRRIDRSVAIAGLLIPLLLLWFSWPVFLADWLVGGGWTKLGNESRFENCFQAHRLFLRELPDIAKDREPLIPLSVARFVCPDQEALNAVGDLYVRLPGDRGGIRPLTSDEPLSNDVLLRIKNREEARQIAIGGLQTWYKTVSEDDSMWPHRPGIAAQAFLFAELGLLVSTDTPHTLFYTDACFLQAERCMKRSPLDARGHELMARAWFYRAQQTDGDEKEQYLDNSLKAYGHAANLRPTVAYFWELYAEALNEAADRASGDDRVRLLEQSRKAQTRAEKLAKIHGE